MLECSKSDEEMDIQFSKTVEYSILILAHIAKHSDQKFSSTVLHQALDIPDIM